MSKLFGADPGCGRTTKLATGHRRWLVVALCLVAVKVGLTLLWIAWHHHVLSLPPRPVFEVLWWITKIAPPISVWAFLQDAVQVGNRTWVRFWVILFVITIVLYIAGTIAMLRGWNGTPV
jgi:Na+/H+-dicarboxylate symporter